jgi:C-terminal processing protease CtpA/Prc
LLVEAWPEGVEAKDQDGKTPLNIALESNAPADAFNWCAILHSTELTSAEPICDGTAPTTVDQANTTPTCSPQEIPFTHVAFRTVSFIRREGLPLGLKLEDQGVRGALIKTVVPGGVAARAGCVVGETIVAINAQSVVGAGYGTVVAAVKAAGLIFSITSAKAKAGTSLPSPPIDSSTIAFARKAGQPLGLTLEDQGGDGRGGVMLKTVVPGGVAARAGCVAGETIVAINAQSVVGVGYEPAVAVVKAAGLAFTMTTTMTFKSQAERTTLINYLVGEQASIVVEHTVL